jgi:hypothetical protein
VGERAMVVGMEDGGGVVEVVGGGDEGRKIWEAYFEGFVRFRCTYYDL